MVYGSAYAGRAPPCLVKLSPSAGEILGWMELDTGAGLQGKLGLAATRDDTVAWLLR